MLLTNTEPTFCPLILQSKYFWEYKNAATKGQELAAQGKREELQSFCIDQVILLYLKQVELFFRTCTILLGK